MKHTLQKLFSLLLCLVLLCSLAPGVLAEDSESILDEAALDQWIQEYMQQHGIGGNQLFSVGFCYTATGDCWFYNPDQFMYSASMYKVPVAMLLAEKEAAGQITQATDLGGGTLQYLESSSLIYSNNDSGHAMLNYLGEDNGGKASKLIIPYSSLDKSYFDPDFFDYSYYSARFMTQVMQTLCEGGEERFPHVISCLLQAQPDSYLNLRLRGKYDVAQKYGAFTERNGNDNNHIAAIVYTPTPIIVVVMTRNLDKYQERMAEIGEYLANYSLELDEKLAERERSAAENPQPIQDGLAPQQTDADGAVLPSTVETGTDAAATAPVRRPYEPGAQIQGGRERLMPAFYVLCAAAALLLILAIVLRQSARRKQAVTVGAGRNSRRSRH